MPDPERQAENTRLRQELAAHPWLLRLVNAVRPPLPYDRHGRWRAQRTFEMEIGRAHPAGSVVIDVGAGENSDQELAGLSAGFRQRLIRTDIARGSRIGFVSDAHRLPVRDGSVDGIIIQGVVEHVARPWVVAQEIIRVLKPGGLVYCDAPFVQWYHEDPNDYYRFTEDGLKQLFEGCTYLESGVSIGPIGAAVGVWREVIPSLFSQRHVYWSLKWLIAWVSFPLVFFDVLYRDRPRAKTIALGVYLIARKPQIACQPNAR